MTQFILPKVLPTHIAIVMDGNGRWALDRHLPRVAGHRAGLQAVRKIVSACVKWEVPALTLFAFSSENWGRPTQEVQFLMQLFHSTLLSEIEELHRHNIRLRIIGDRAGLQKRLQDAIIYAEKLTADNRGLNLSIAINYGGRADIAAAMQIIAEKVKQGLVEPSEITPDLIGQHVALSTLPYPDLLIRTSGELRISNFLLWQLAYAELYFTEQYWPDFDEAALYTALCEFAKRERRYGTVTEISKVLEHA